MFACVLCALSMSPLHAQETVTLSIRGVIDRPALLFQTDGPSGVVLVHQAGYHADSWTSFAEQLKAAGITSIALHSTSSEDVETGIEFLQQLGKQRISLIGASIGGGAVQRVVSSGDLDVVHLVVLLGTADGNMADVADIDKLFVVSEGDFASARTHSSFEKASDPKELLVYPGVAHGQEMFLEEYGPELVEIILAAIQD